MKGGIFHNIAVNLLQSSVLCTDWHFNGVNTAAFRYKLQTRSFVTINAFAGHFNIKALPCYNKKVLRLHIFKPCIAPANGYVKTRNPAAVVIALHIVKKAVGTLMQNNKRLGNSNSSFLQSIKIIIGRIIKKPFVGWQHTQIAAPYRNTITHINLCRYFICIGFFN